MTTDSIYTECYVAAQKAHDERSKEVKSTVGAILGHIQSCRHPHLAYIGAHNNVKQRGDCGWAIQRRPDGKMHAQCYKIPSNLDDPILVAFSTDPTWRDDVRPMPVVAGMKFARQGLDVFMEGMCEHTFFPDLRAALDQMIEMA